MELDRENDEDSDVGDVDKKTNHKPSRTILSHGRSYAMMFALGRKAF